MPILGVIASSTRQGLAPVATGSYDALATYTVPSGGVSSITFAGLPTGGQYSHLQIRYSARAGRSATEFGFLWLNLNNAVSTRFHTLYGNGSSAAAYEPGVSNPNNNYGYQLQAPGSTANSAIYGAGIIDILDYTSTTKNKTVRSLTGVDTNGAGIVSLTSHLFSTTSPIDSISIGSVDGFNTPAGSTFALYGVK
jgi:hypothetical protein